MEPASPGSPGADVRAVECDAEMTTMRKELTEFGFNEEDLCKEEMNDLLQALRYSKSSANEEEHLRSKSNESSESTESNHKLLRRYRAVADRRLPWCLLPSNLTSAQKVKCLSAYIKLLSINQYMKARSMSKFEVWAPPLNISAGSPTRSLSTRATRSGRCFPSYAFIDADDDSNELDNFITRKPKKRKVSNSEISSSNELGVYSNKTLSLKRKTQKADCARPEKETKVEGNKEVCLSSTDSADRDHDEVYAENSTASICNIFESICNSSGDCSSKDPLRTIKPRQRKT